MKSALLDRLNAARADRVPVALVTHVKDGHQALVFEEACEGELALASDLLAEVRAMLADDRSGLKDELFVRSYPAPLRMVIVGAVHIAQALAPMAALAGYDVFVVDPRGAFATEQRFPGVELSTDWPDEALAARPLDRHTALVTLTHDPKLDDPALDLGLLSGAFYIGALGSKRTHAARVERLTALGHGPDAIARIHGPVGLDLGAVSPAEIAVSVLAQVIAVRRGAVP